MLHVFSGYFGQKYFGCYRAIMAGLLLACIGEVMIGVQTITLFYVGLVVFRSHSPEVCKFL